MSRRWRPTGFGPARRRSSRSRFPLFQKGGRFTRTLVTPFPVEHVDRSATSIFTLENSLTDALAA